MPYDLIDDECPPIVAGETFTRGYELTPDAEGDPWIDPTGMSATAMFRTTENATTADLTLTSPSGGLVFVEGDADTPTALHLTINSAQTTALLTSWASRRRGVFDIRLTDAAGIPRYLVKASPEIIQPVTR